MERLGRGIMAGYSPLRITGMSTGLVEERENFLLPDDAYPILENAYVWRERILRKQGCQLLGRLQLNVGVTNGVGFKTVNLLPTPIQPGVTFIVVGTDTFTDPGGPSPVALLTNNPGASGTLDRATGVINLQASVAAIMPIQYFPGLPVMGIRIRELQDSPIDETVVFDQAHAYIFNATTQQFQEFIAGTTWNAAAEDVSGIDFFWSTNYWVSSELISVASIPPAYDTIFTTTNKKLFWVTNNSGHSRALADPPRITDGTKWLDFYHDVNPTINSPWAQIDATNFLVNWLCMLPFRGRMVTFNTWEGPDAAGSLQYSNRIRWSTIGNPFIAYTAGPPAAGSWRSDIRGQGGFLDIPTSEDIVSVGFVRDNLVIYCERSTWQLRYTGRSIAPFQIEKVNSELGTESTFSSVQFDTSLVGIGDKGIVECDSYKSQRIDIKIPDFVFKFNTRNDGVARVQGIRDFPNRLAYWTITLAANYSPHVPNDSKIFPNARLVYNYENDSWATFTDSLTTLGNYQEQSGVNWVNTHQPWINLHFPWINRNIGDPVILGGNQQGFVFILNELNQNDVSLFISNITNGTPDTIITSPNHNLSDDFIISIRGIPTGSPYDGLNNGVYKVEIIDADTFTLLTYNSTTDEFSDGVQISSVDPYVGGGLINVRDNFSIVSKKFNFLDEGQNIQLGFLDILMSATGDPNPGSISLNVYLDYDDENASNTYPQNEIDGSVPPGPDTFFNSVIPTSPSPLSVAKEGTKFWHRVFCATRANFLTLEYKFNNEQMNGKDQELPVQIDAQILWIRKAGRMSQI